MNLRKLAGEHTIDLDLLPDEPLVLDAGCRSFNFCAEIFSLRPNARIVAVDPGPDIEVPNDQRIIFLLSALDNRYRDRVWLKMAGCESIISPTPQPGWAEVSVMSFHDLIGNFNYFD